MNLRTFTVNNIRDLHPCYDPVTGIAVSGAMLHPGGFVAEDWSGNALDILRMDRVPTVDRFWVVSHHGWVDDRLLRQFVAAIAERGLDLLDGEYPACREIIQAGGRYGRGEISLEKAAQVKGRAWRNSTRKAGLSKPFTRPEATALILADESFLSSTSDSLKRTIVNCARLVALHIVYGDSEGKLGSVPFDDNDAVKKNITILYLTALEKLAGELITWIEQANQ